MNYSISSTSNYNGSNLPFNAFPKQYLPSGPSESSKIRHYSEDKYKNIVSDDTLINDKHKFLSCLEAINDDIIGIKRDKLLKSELLQKQQQQQQKQQQQQQYQSVPNITSTILLPQELSEMRYPSYDALLRIRQMRENAVPYEASPPSSSSSPQPPSSPSSRNIDNNSERRNITPPMQSESGLPPKSPERRKYTDTSDSSQSYHVTQTSAPPIIQQPYQQPYQQPNQQQQVHEEDTLHTNTIYQNIDNDNDNDNDKSLNAPRPAAVFDEEIDVSGSWYNSRNAHKHPAAVSLDLSSLSLDKLKGMSR